MAQHGHEVACPPTRPDRETVERAYQPRRSHSGAPGTLGLGRPETRGPLAGTLVARALSWRLAVPDQGRARASEHWVTTPWGTDSDGAKPTACVIGVLTARAGALTCD